MTKVGIFYENPFRLGGTETWILNICLVYKDKYDITIYYPDNLHIGENVAEGAYDRLANMVKVVPLSTEVIETDIALFAFDYFHLPLVKADKKILFIHPGDGHGNHPRKPEAYSDFDEVVGVSQYTVDKMAKWCPGLEVKRVYNPVPEQELRFISMSRSAKEKGLEKTVKLARALHASGVKFRWDVYTDYQGTVDSPYMNFCKPTIHSIDKIREADFLVQLSKYESFGFSLVEGMQYAKLITTDIEILPEMGITKENAVIVPMTRINYKKVVEDILSRVYKPPQTDYSVILGKPSEGSEPSRIKVKNTTEQDHFIADQDFWIDEYAVSFVYDTPDARALIDKKVLKEI